MPAPVEFNHTVLRDGHQSLAATRMKTAQMLPAAPILDGMGFHGIETWGGGDDRFVPPFPARESLRSVTGIEENRTEDAVDHAAPGQNIVQYTSFPDDVVEAFVRADAEAGRDVSRVFDALNDTRNLKTAIQTVLDCGKHARGEICYTTSPVHPIDAFIKMEGGSSGTWDATRLGLRIWPES